MSRHIFRILAIVGFTVALVGLVAITRPAVEQVETLNISVDQVLERLDAGDAARVRSAGMEGCHINVTISHPTNLRIGSVAPIRFNGTLLCPPGNPAVQGEVFLLRMQGPLGFINPIGEIRARSGETIWAMTGAGSSNWEGVLRVDLLAGSAQIPLVAKPLTTRFTRILGLDQTGLYILTGCAFLLGLFGWILSFMQKKKKNLHLNSREA
jgi:hypothetical protein